MKYEYKVVYDQTTKKEEEKQSSACGFMLARRTTMSCSHLCHNIQGAFVNHHFAKERDGMH